MPDFDGLDVSVVLPTYNESNSLPVVVPRIAKALTDAGLNGEIIVVDDASPDGTAAVAEQLGHSHRVRVLRRTTERGLATAVIAGFRSSNATVCLVMDADGSHPVEALGAMVRMILDDKAEIVVGSRHVRGGGSKDWPLFAQLKSRFAASLAVGLTSMTDPTTGLMAVRRSLLTRLRLDPVGWKIVLETVVKARPARLAEVPIVFTDREHGESKQSVRVLLQYLRHLYRLYDFRFPALVEFLKFCLVGAFGIFVDLSVVALLRELYGVDTRLCQVFGFSAAVTFNYAVNRHFSFEHARGLPVVSSYVKYVGANLVGLTVRMLAIHALLALTTLDGGTGYGYLLLSAIGITLSTLVNFVGVKYLAFAPYQQPRLDASDPPASTAPPQPPTAVALAAAILASVWCGVAVWYKSTLTPDERVNARMAEHIQAGIEGLVHPHVTETPPSDWVTDALPSLGNTPVYPALLALVTPARAGSAALSAAILALTLFGVWLALRPRADGSAKAALLLFASTPWVVQPFTLLEFEPLVTSLGALGFAFVAVASRARRGHGTGLVGGLLLGLGFATKLWLILPAWFACLAYLTVRPYPRLDENPASTANPWRSVLIGCALGSGSHLAFVAASAPGDLPLWIARVYLAIFKGAGVTGEKLSEDTRHADSNWAYARFLLRDHGGLVAPIMLGLPALTRRLDGLGRASIAASLGAVGALVPLSVPVYKEPLYLLPALPFLYMLAGLCLVAPDRAPRRSHGVNRAAARLAIACGAMISISWLILGVLDHDLSPLRTALHIGHVAIWMLPAITLVYSGASSKALAPTAALSLALTALALAVDT